MAQRRSTTVEILSSLETDKVSAIGELSTTVEILSSLETANTYAKQADIYNSRNSIKLGNKANVELGLLSTTVEILSSLETLYV